MSTPRQDRKSRKCERKLWAHLQDGLKHPVALLSHSSLLKDAILSSPRGLKKVLAESHSFVYAFFGGQEATFTAGLSYCVPCYQKSLFVFTNTILSPVLGPLSQS